MRIHKSFLTVFFLFLHLPASITWAQSTQIIKGLSVTEVTSASGKIKVYLPYDINPGDNISGSLVLEPSGKNAKQKAKNAATVFVFKVNDQLMPLHWQAAGDQFNSYLPSFTMNTQTKIFFGEENKPLVQLPISPLTREMISARLNTFVTSSHALAGSPLYIFGPFDGDASNTSCQINGHPLRIIAESPRQCIVDYPPSSNKVNELTVKEKEMTAQQKIYNVHLDVATGRLDLKKGEGTYLDIIINGLETLNDTAVLKVDNISSSVVTVEGGNNQMIFITPFDTSAKMAWTRHFTVTSFRNGTFAINVDLLLPQPEALYGLFCNDECKPVGAETDATVGEVAISSNEKSDPDEEAGAFANAKWIVKNTDLFGATGNEESALDAMMTEARTRGYLVWVKYCWKRCIDGWFCKYWEDYCGPWVPVIWVTGLENSGNNTFTATGGRAIDDSKIEGLTRKQILELAVKIGNKSAKKK